VSPNKDIKLVHCSVCDESGTSVYFRKVDGQWLCDKCLKEKKDLETK